MQVLADLGFVGLQRDHKNRELSVKKTKNRPPLSEEDKKANDLLATERVLVEHMFGIIKRCEIFKHAYHDAREGFATRINLAFGLYNAELILKVKGVLYEQSDQVMQ